MEKAPNGTYTPIPNVFFDTCDLPETAQILYLRLYRHIHYRGCRFVGSIRMLARLVRLSKSTVDRMVKRLEKSKLIKVLRGQGEETSAQIMEVTILKGELWELNRQHEIEPVPVWDTEMPDCPNLGQSVPPEGQDIPDRDELSQAQAQNEALNNTNQSKQKEKEIEPSPQIFEEEKNPPVLSLSLGMELLKTLRLFGECSEYMMSAAKEVLAHIYSNRPTEIDEFTFKLLLTSAKEEANRATLEQAYQLGYESKTAYFMACLYEKLQRHGSSSLVNNSLQHERIAQ